MSTENAVRDEITLQAMTVMRAEMERLLDENKSFKAKLEKQKEVVNKAKEYLRKHKANNEEAPEKKSSSKKAKVEDKVVAKDDSKKESKKEETVNGKEDDKSKKQKAPPKCGICNRLRKGNDHTECKKTRDEQKKKEGKKSSDDNESS